MPTENSPDGFDYKSLSPSVAKFLKGQAERIQRGQAASIVQTGRSLIEAKRHLSHGQFLHWVEIEAGIHARTAQAYMQVAQWAKGKGATVTRLPPSLLYFLSARGTPEEFVGRLLERLDAGEQINLKAARAELEAARKPRSREAPIWTGNSAPAAALAHIELVPTRPNDASVMDAVSILNRALSPPDFATVRAIFTSKTVLESPNLAQEILSAFARANAAKESILRGQYSGVAA